MDHLAIDLGSRKSQICVRDSKGTITQEDRVDTTRIERVFSSRSPCRVIVETCAEAFAVADLARQAGHDVRVVPSSLAPTLGIGARRTKSDQRDARTISEVSTRIDLPSVHIPTLEARQHSALISSRQVLVAARTMHINHCRGWLRTKIGTLSRGSRSTFTKRMRELSPPSHIEAVLVSIDQTTAQIAELDKEIAKHASSSALCRRLMTVPGVGPITALRFAAAVGDISRFHSSHALQSYFGLVPGESSSGDRQQRISWTKAGNAHVRWLLVQAAWTAWRTQPEDPMSRWATRIAIRRGKHYERKRTAKVPEYDELLEMTAVIQATEPLAENEIECPPDGGTH